MSQPILSGADQLRGYLGERIPEGGVDTDTFFTDEEVDGLLQTWGDIPRATLAGWVWKMAEWARLIDINESGSERKLNQRWRAAQAQVNYWTQYVKDAQSVINVASRIAGRPIKVRDVMKERDTEWALPAPCEPDTPTVMWTPSYNRLRTARR